MTLPMLGAVIADDEPWARSHLRALLEHCGVRTLVECSTGHEAITATAREHPDLLCLDVRMPDLDGLDVARRLRADILSDVRDIRPAIVFTTGYADYAAPAFDLDAADYLVKPLAASRVEEAVRRVRSRLSRTAVAATAPPCAGLGEALDRRVSRVFVPHGDHHVALAPETILYAVAHRRFCDVYTDGDTHRLRTRLSRLEHLLAPYGFLRTHRAYLVNLRRVRALVPWSRHVASVLLDGGGETHIPVAKSRLAIFRRSVVWIAAAEGRPARRSPR